MEQKNLFDLNKIIMKNKDSFKIKKIRNKKAQTQINIA